MFEEVETLMKKRAWSVMRDKSKRVSMLHLVEMWVVKRRGLMMIATDDRHHRRALMGEAFSRILVIVYDCMLIAYCFDML